MSDIRPLGAACRLLQELPVSQWVRRYFFICVRSVDSTGRMFTSVTKEAHVFARTRMSNGSISRKVGEGLAQNEGEMENEGDDIRILLVVGFFL